MLLDLLKAKQVKLGLSDTQFAARLGISFDMWRSIQVHRRGFGKLALRGVLSEFPELRDQVLLYLRSDGTAIQKRGMVVREVDLAEIAGG